VIYVDANVIIRLLERDAATRAPLEARLLPLRGTGRFLLTSRLTRLECRVKPLRTGDTRLLALYDSFFTGAEVQLLEVVRTQRTISLLISAHHPGSRWVVIVRAPRTGHPTGASCTEAT
jgi:predicted nucleic acid-binding protein